MSELDYSIRAEQRAVEEGHHAWLNDDGSIKVHSDSQPGVHYRVEFEDVGGAIRFRCNCPAGEHRRELVPCKHAALAARRLEREGLAEWRYGIWYVPEHLRPRLPILADPLEGLPHA